MKSLTFMWVTVAVVSVIEVTVAQRPNVTLDFGAPETGTYTMDEIAALQAEVDQVNAQQRVEESPWTIEQWLLAVAIQNVVDNAVSLDEQSNRVIACERFNVLTPTKQAEITSRLGGLSPCET